MRVRSSLFLIGAVAGLATGPLLAQTAQASDNSSAKPAHDPNEVICEKQEVLGSRLATKKVCMTRAQWADAKKQDREAIEKVQVQRGCNDRC